MNTDNQPTSDDGYRKAWQQAFDQAAETPPPRVWNAVERQLDADNRTRIIPLWANTRPWVMGLAASVTFILTGWWVWHTVLPASPDALSGKIVTNNLATETVVAIHNSKKLPASAKPNVNAGMHYHNLPGQGEVSQQHPTISTPARATVARIAEPATIISSVELPRKLKLADLPTVSSRVSRINDADSDFRANVSTDRVSGLVAFGQSNVHTVSLLAESESVQSDAQERINLAVDPLSGKSFRNRQLAIQRAVWFRNNEVPAEEKVLARAQKREKWVALSVMPSSFNPAVALQSQWRFCNRVAIAGICQRHNRYY